MLRLFQQNRPFAAVRHVRNNPAHLPDSGHWLRGPRRQQVASIRHYPNADTSSLNEQAWIERNPEFLNLPV